MESSPHPWRHLAKSESRPTHICFARVCYSSRSESVDFLGFGWVKVCGAFESHAERSMTSWKGVWWIMTSYTIHPKCISEASTRAHTHTHMHQHKINIFQCYFSDHLALIMACWLLSVNWIHKYVCETMSNVILRAQIDNTFVLLPKASKRWTIVLTSVRTEWIDANKIDIFSLVLESEATFHCAYFDSWAFRYTPAASFNKRVQWQCQEETLKATTFLTIQLKIMHFSFISKMIIRASFFILPKSNCIFLSHGEMFPDRPNMFLSAWIDIAFFSQLRAHSLFGEQQCSTNKENGTHNETGNSNTNARTHHRSRFIAFSFNSMG